MTTFDGFPQRKPFRAAAAHVGRGGDGLGNSGIRVRRGSRRDKGEGALCRAPSQYGTEFCGYFVSVSVPVFETPSYDAVMFT